VWGLFAKQICNIWLSQSGLVFQNCLGIVGILSIDGAHLSIAWHSAHLSSIAWHSAHLSIDWLALLRLSNGCLKEGIARGAKRSPNTVGLRAGKLKVITVTPSTVQQALGL
jgi:hypothetical protein